MIELQYGITSSQNIVYIFAKTITSKSDCAAEKAIELFAMNRTDNFNTD